MSRALLSAGALVLLLALPPAAPAWWHYGPRPAPVVAGYAPAPVVFVAPRPVFVAAPVLVPAAPPPPACVAPASPLPAFAAPAPAPPSGSPEPPLAKPSGPPMPPAQPSAYQAASPAAGARSYDTYPLAVRGAATGERCSVSFWNLTGRDVVLRVEGRTQVLPRGQSLTRELPRSFAWQVDGGEQRTEQVSAKDGGLEVVLRW